MENDTTVDSSEMAPVLEGVKTDIVTGTHVSSQGGFMQIIDKVALLDNIDVDKLERMMQIQLQWEAQQAKKNFAGCMTRISSRLANIRIIKSKTVGYDIDKNDKSKGTKEAFRYTPIDEIDKVVRPILNEEGMSISYDTELSAMTGWHTVIIKLSHAGHTESSRIPLPLDVSGGKNNTQGMGSTYSYGKRYALCAAFNIITVGEDDDAQGGPITDEQAKQIKDGLRETGLDGIKFLKAMKAETVEEIRTKELPRALAAIENKRYMNKKEADKKETK